MSDTAQQIKDKLDIVDFLKNYIQLLPAGKNLKALCPFHKEKTPSFIVSPERGSWHCFGGCNEGGDIFSFLMKFENLDFYEALQILAAKAGIDLKKTGGYASDYKQYDALYAANFAAKDFFKEKIGSVLSYCLERGLNKETIEEFELGYAPNTSDQLLRYLLAKGFAVSDIEKAGLVFRTERGTYWDRFRGRLMFPLYNSFGKVIGFTGRVIADPAHPELVEGLAKYVNSPETPIFNKSKTLYGLHKSKGAIRDSQLALLVEGQMDFLMTYQSGVKNVVATSGTALTNDHLTTVRRLTDKIILSFDNDEAGQNAIERTIDLALAHDFSVKILSLSEKDPADMAKNNPELFKKLILSAKSSKDFYFDRYLKNREDSYQIKKGIRYVLSKIKRLSSQLDQSDWLKDLSARTNISEKNLVLEMDQLPVSVNLAVNKQKLSSEKEASNDVWSRKQLIAQRILDLGGAPELSLFASEILQTQNSPLLSLKASLENSALSPEAVEEEKHNLIKQLKLEFYKEKITLLKNIIARTERDGDAAALNIALREFDNTSREFHNTMNKL